jgi:hypothetical protein
MIHGRDEDGLDEVKIRIYNIYSVVETIVFVDMFHMVNEVEKSRNKNDLQIFAQVILLMGS